MADLAPAPPEITERVKRVIAAHFPHLRESRFKVQVRDTMQMGENSAAWAEVDTPDNDEEAREFDFALWFASEVWEGLDDYQRDALTFHELMHCRFDEKGRPLLVRHDIQVFNAELALYGLWWGNDAQDTLDALNVMPPLHRAEGANEMPHLGAYQRPMQGNHGSSGAGNHGSSGAGNHGSSGAFGAPVWSDPDLVAGQDFHVIDIGNGRVIELTPQAFQAAVASILADLQGAMGQAPEPGNHGSSGA